MSVINSDIDFVSNIHLDMNKLMIWLSVSNCFLTKHFDHNMQKDRFIIIFSLIFTFHFLAIHTTKALKCVFETVTKIFIFSFWCCLHFWYILIEAFNLCLFWKLIWSNLKFDVPH